MSDRPGPTLYGLCIRKGCDCTVTIKIAGAYHCAAGHVEKDVRPLPLLSPMKAIARLKELQRDGDIERAHGDADKVLCELLTTLGYADVVAEWDEVPKWYA
jgi:hypothetical protein